MATTSETEIVSSSSQEGGSRPIEQPAVGLDSDEYGCGWSCWYLLSWVTSLILYTVECFVTAWVAYTYAANGMFVPFGISLAYLAIPQVILVTLSLTWYYNLDRYHRKKRESEPQSQEKYRRKFNCGAVICHVLLLGMVYRYSQLIYLVLIRKTNNIPFLRRDTTFLRLVHSLLVSAPLVLLHLYVVLQYLPPCLDPATPCTVFTFPSFFVALGSSLANLLYSILAFATNDRLSGKRRRVILPAHLMQILWYVCTMASRMLAIVLFAFVYNYYVFAFIGGHWIVMFLFLLIQRTTFCADVVKETDSKVKIKRRWCLELSFDCVAATMYIFAFFGFRRGKTRYWALTYHLLMYAEIVTMSVLFFTEKSSKPNLHIFSLTSLTLALGLYPVGCLFILTYYLFFHPNKTGQWYWIGFPKPHSRRGSADVSGRGFRNRTPCPDGSLEISGPTLVAHNGFIPRDMLPEDVPSSPGHKARVATNPTDIIAQTQEEQRRQDWIAPRPTGASNGGRGFLNSLTLVSPHSTGKSTTVASDTFPILSDGQSLIGPSDLDTDISSGILHVPQGDIKGDTIIDTPLFGNTPDPTQQLKTHLEPASGTLRSHTDTVDTGIDVGADTPLTQGTNEYSGEPSEYYPRHREDMTLGLDIDLPQFNETPAKRNSYVPKKSTLESHYFPDHQSHDSITPTLPTPNWDPRSSSSTKPLLLRHSSSGESGEVYPTRVKSSGQHHHVLPLAVSTPERTKRNVPRSPKGARAFTISMGEEGRPPSLSRNRVTHNTPSYPSHVETYRHHSPPRQRAPRSPKGARRMMITQDVSKPKPELVQTNRHSFTNTYYQSKGVLNYQRQPTAAAKTPDGRRRNITRAQPVQKSHSIHVPPSVRSPERLPRGVAGYRCAEGASLQHKQYIQQQQQNRSRWDRWAAEQEEKRRQSSSEATPQASKYKVEVTQSYPSGHNPRVQSGIPRNVSEEFDHLEPCPLNDPDPHGQQDMTDGSSSVTASASIAPQGYPRAPQGARGTTPQVGWSPARSDRISLSPQRSVHSVPGISLIKPDSGALSASCRIPRAPSTRPADSYRMSQRLSSGSYNKFYAPTSSTHQSVV